MNILKTSSVIALALVTSLIPATAQGDDEGRASRRNMRIISFGGQAESVFYEIDGQKVELIGSEGSFSPDIPIPKDKVLKLYHQVGAAEGEGKGGAPVEYKPVGSVDVSGGSRMIVILFIPTDLTKEMIRGRAYKDSYSTHRGMTARVFNMITQEVAIRAGNEGISLPSGGEGIMPWKPIGFNAVPYKIATRSKDGAKWKTVESGEGAGREDLRTFLFIIEDAYEEGVSVTAYPVLDPVFDDAGE